MSLRKALTIPFVLLMLILAGVIALLSYRTGQDAVNHLTERHIAEIAHRVSLAVERHLVGARVALEAVFPEHDGRYQLPPSAISDLEPRMAVATALHTDPNNYVYFGTHDGQFLGVYRQDKSSVEVRQKKLASAPRELIHVDELTGKRALIKREEAIFEPRERPWYKQAVAANAPAWTPVYVDFTKKELVTTRVHPVHRASADGGKALAGVLATDVSLAKLSAFMKTLSASKNGVVYLVDSGGELIASSTGDALSMTEGAQVKRIAATTSASMLIRESYVPFRDYVVKGAQISTPLFKRINTSAGATLTAVHIIRDKLGLSWYVIVAAPESDFTAPFSKAVLISILLSIGAAAIAVMIGLWILNWVTRDIAILSQATSRLREGQSYSPLPIQRGDEIGLLARSFERMHIDLQTDPLSQLYNRDTFTKLMNREIAMNEAIPLPDHFGLLFIDLDRFKDVNDEHGHITGNRVLAEVATRLKSTLRSEDIVCRYAGDEFTALVRGLDDYSSAKVIVEKIHAAIAAPMTEIVGKYGEPLQIQASVGYAIYPSDGRTDLELINVADKRMYRDKWLSR
jgi:diguanylate cyclase (GGDEF)-like protein